MAVEGDPCKPSISRRIAQRLASGVTVMDEDPMDGGFTVSQWMTLWAHTHRGGVRTEWPDGGSLIEQPAIAVNMLDLVGEGIAISQREASASSGR